MEPKSDMVSFRAGALNERLRSGPLTAGGKSKRDLARYYALLDEAFDDWYERHLLQSDGWPPVVGFVSTRYWDAVPRPEHFHEQFVSFVRSPMAKEWDGVDLSVAATALAGMSLLQVCAVIDRAEREVTEQDDATAGATLAAS